MADSTKLIVILALTLAACIAPAASQAACSINNRYQNSNLYSIQAEKNQLALDRFISGSNLTYTVEEDPQTGAHTIQQTIYEQKQATQYAKNSKFINQAFYQDEFGGFTYMTLMNDLEDPSHQKYTIQFGAGDITSISQVQNIVFLNADNIDCHSSLMARPDIGVIACQKTTTDSQTQEKKFDQLYYIAKKGQYLPSKQQFKSFSPKSQATDIKSKMLKTAEGLFIMTMAPYNKWSTGATNDSYINVFRFITNDMYPDGYLIQGSPIDATSFDLENLQLVDMDIIGERVFLLDNNIGVMSFSYIGNQVVDVQSFQISDKCWGLNAVQSGAVYDISLTCRSQILNYHQLIIQGVASALMIQSYQLPNTYADVVDMQSNFYFYLIQQNNVATLYQRKQYNISRSNQSIYPVVKMSPANQATLLPSNNLIVNSDASVYNYRINPALLSIYFSDKTDDTKITITALSVDGDDKKPCTLQLLSKFLASDNQDIQETAQLAHPSREIIADFSSLNSVDEVYVGPNIKYSSKFESEALPVSLNQFETHHLRRGETFQWPAESEGATAPTLSDIVLQTPGNINLRYYENPPTFKNPVNQMVIFDDEDFSNRDYFSFVASDSVALQMQYFCSQEASKPDQYICDWTDQTKSVAGLSIFKQVAINSQNLLLQVNSTALNQIVVKDYYGRYKRTLTFADTIEDIIPTSEMLVLQFIKQSQDSVTHYIEVYPINKLMKTDLAVIYQINAQTVAGWPIPQTIDWSKIQILYDKEQRNLLVVQFPQGFLFIRLLEKPQFQVFANVDTEATKAKAVVTNAGMLVFALNAENDEEIIYQYSFQESVQKLEIVKQISLYQEFTLVKPFVVTKQFSSGLVYALAQNAATQEMALIVIRTQGALIQQFYQGINLGVTPQDPSKWKLFSNGMHQSEIVGILTDAGKMILLRIPEWPRILTYPIYSVYNTYTENIGFDVMYTSMKGSTQTFNQNLRLINQQTQGKVNTTAVARDLNHTFAVQNNRLGGSWEFNPADWVVGTVLSYSIECRDCYYTIYLNNTVNQLHDKSILDMHNVNDTWYDQDSKILYVVQSNILYSLDSHLEEVYAAIFLPVDDKEAQCQRISPGYNQEQKLDYLFTMCLDLKSKNYILIPISMSGPKPTAATPINLDFVKSINSIYYVDDYLLVNELTNGVVYVLQFNFAESTYKIITTYDSTTLGQDNVYITSFTVYIKENALLRKVFLTNQQHQIFILSIKDFDYVNVSVEKLEVDDLLTRNNLYITAATQLVNLQTFDIENKIGPAPMEVLYYQMLLVTSNTAIYQLAIAFMHNMQEKTTQLNYTSCRVDYVYSSLPDSKVSTKISILKQYFAIEYMLNSYNVSKIAVYPLNRTYSSSGYIPLAKAIGAVGYATSDYVNQEENARGDKIRYVQLPFELYLNEFNQVQMVAYSGWWTRKFVTAIISPNITLGALSNQFSAQTVQFYCSSQLDTRIYLFDATIDPSGIKPKPHESPLKPWEIVLMAVGGLLVLIVIIFVIYKCKKNKFSRFNEISELNKDLISLQQQTRPANESLEESHKNK